VEAEPLVIGGVPRHTAERDQRHRWQALANGPAGHVIEQHRADALVRVRRVNADLLDARGPVDDVDHDEADRLVVVVHGGPGAPRLPVPVQGLGGQRRAFRDGAHPHVPEGVARRQLDCLQPAHIPGPHAPYRNGSGS